jgi:CubicO group peptidase (beta-lactamase class C family)
VEKITVRHLLTHTCGGWRNDGEDPMFRKQELSPKELIAWTLREQSLKNEPGKSYAYSNFGYCILGRIIEKLTGGTYEEYVQKSILAKCGVTAMRLGGNTLQQKAKNEVIYYARNGENAYKMNVTRMDAHGGWIGSPSDLVRFAMHVDGFSTTPQILGAQSIKTMTTPTEVNATYACGWAVNKVPNWWHGGSLPGTSTILVRTASGLCWAAFVNTRANADIDGFMWKMVKAVPAWKA